MLAGLLALPAQGGGGGAAAAAAAFAVPAWSGLTAAQLHVRSEMVEAAIGAAACVARGCAEIGTALVFQQAHTRVCQAASAVVPGGKGCPPRCRARAINLVGSVAQMPHDDNAHAAYTAVVLGALTKDPSLNVVAEALDVLFDLYCEDEDYLGVWTRMGIMGTLQALVPQLKRRWNAEKRQLHDIEQAIVQEALLNLTRFIAYKKSHGAM